MIYTLLSQFLFWRFTNFFRQFLLAKITITTTCSAFRMYVCDKVALLGTELSRGRKNSYSWRLNCSLVDGFSTILNELWNTVGLYGISTNSPFSKTSIRQVFPTAPSPMITSFLSFSAMVNLLAGSTGTEGVSLARSYRLTLSKERWYVAW